MFHLRNVLWQCLDTATYWMRMHPQTLLASKSRPVRMGLTQRLFASFNAIMRRTNEGGLVRDFSVSRP